MRRFSSAQRCRFIQYGSTSVTGTEDRTQYLKFCSVFVVVWFPLTFRAFASQAQERLQKGINKPATGYTSVQSEQCSHSYVSVPQEHLTGSAVGVLLKRVHLEVVLIGRGSLRLDIRATDRKTRLIPRYNLTYPSDTFY